MGGREPGGGGGGGGGGGCMGWVHVGRGRDACGLRGGAYGWGCGVVHGLVAECGDVW